MREISVGPTVPHTPGLYGLVLHRKNGSDAGDLACTIDGMTADGQSLTTIYC